MADEKIIYKKMGAEKHVRPHSRLIPTIEADGWVCHKNEPKGNKEDLILKAKKLGLKVSSRMKIETIESKIAEALDDDRANNN